MKKLNRKNSHVIFRYPEDRKAKAIKKARLEKRYLSEILAEFTDDYISEGDNVNRNNTSGKTD